MWLSCNRPDSRLIPYHAEVQVGSKNPPRPRFTPPTAMVTLGGASRANEVV
jgi:hypothetical protein